VLKKSAIGNQPMQQPQQRRKNRAAESRLKSSDELTVQLTPEINPQAEAHPASAPLAAGGVAADKSFSGQGANKSEDHSSRQNGARKNRKFQKNNDANGDADNGEQPTGQGRTKRANSDQSTSNPKAPGGKASDKAASDRNTAGGGGKGGGPGLHKHADDPDFRNALGNAIKALRSNLLTIGIFSFAVNMLILAMPLYLFQISDRVLTSRSLDTLVMLTVVVVLALGVHVALDVIRRFLLMRIAVQMETTLGAPVLSSAISVSKHGSNREFQALMDLQNLRNFVTGNVMLTFFDSFMVPIYLLVVFLIHPQLGVIVVISALLLLGVALANQRMTAVPFARAGGFNMRANLQADAIARNSLVINAMGMVSESVALWGRETAQALINQVSAQDRNIIMAGVSKFVRLSTQVLMLGWGAYLALQSELTGGMVIAASIVASRALAPVIGAIEGWRSFISARSGYGRIKTLLLSSPLNYRRLKLPRTSGELSVERLLYVPPATKKVILNGLTFNLAPGELMAIVGPSGSGKTTLARMLVGAMAPTAGSIRLDKMDIRNWDPRQFGETVGYLPQDVELFPASIKSNIARMREDITDEMIFNAAEIAGVHELISQLPGGYETAIAMDGSPLSGGQKQRIGLARAFFGEPRIVVLDEPNSNLDPAGEAALTRALLNAKKQGITVIAVVQRPSLLSCVDKIMLLNNGKIEALGPRAQVMARLTGSGKKG